MKIRVLRNVGWKDTVKRDNDNPTSLELPKKRDGSFYREGEVVDCNKDDGERFIKTGVGEQVAESK